MHPPMKAAAIACVLTVCSVSPAEDLTVPLEIVAGEGCVYDAHSARAVGKVAGPNAEGVIVIEAETPLRHVCRPNVRHIDAPAPTDASASGSAYMDALVYARYAFVSPKNQDLVVWARAAAEEGHWRFWEYLNGRHVALFQDMKVESKPKGWHWIERGSRPANAGWNWLDVIEYGYQFPKIDKWVLAPKGYAPTGLGPMPTIQNSAKAWVETADVQVPGLNRVVAIEGLAADAKLSVSTDSGKTWRALPVAQGAANLGGITTEADGTVRFKVEFSKDRAVGPLRLKVDVDPQRCVVIEHSDTRVVLDAKTGGLFLVENTKTGDVVVAPGKARPMVAIDFKKTGEPKWTRVGPECVVPRVAEPDKRRKGRWVDKAQEPIPGQVLPLRVTTSENSFAATYRFAQPGLGRAQVTCTIEPGEEGAWRFAVKTDVLEGPADVVSVVFPILERVRVGASGLDDHQLRLQSFGHTRIMPGKAPIRDTRYLGGCVMPWTEVYDGRTGLYVGSHDPEGINVLFTSKAGGRLADHFTMATEKRHQIRAGESRTWNYAVAAHSGEWHWGADRYRSWFYRVHGQAEYPEWMHTCNGWIDLQAENYGESFHFDQLPDWLTRARLVGLDWVQVWGQFAYAGGPCCAAFYGLSPAYGGASAWSRAAGGITRRGGHVGGYFVFDRVDLLPLTTGSFLGHFKSGQYPPDSRWPSAAFGQRMWLVSDPSNTPTPWPAPAEELAKLQQRIEEHRAQRADGKRAKAVHWWRSVYVNDPEWWGFLKHWIVDKYVRDYGCNTVYIDVLGCGGARESFDARRGHNGDGGWGQGKLGIAKTVATAARAACPDFAATMEGLGDLPGLYFASMCSGVYRGGRNVYRYTFPERILIHGMANPGSGGTALSRYLETFVEGMRFDVVGRSTALPLLLMQLHRQFTPWLYQARFMDTVGVQVSDARVQVRRFRLQGAAVRGHLLTVTNRDGLVNVQISLDAATVGRPKAAFAVESNGSARAVALGRGPGRSTFTAATAMASMVLLLDEPSGGPALWPVLHLDRQSPPRLIVTLLNLTGQRQSGPCTVSNLGFTEPYHDRMAQAQAALPFAAAAKHVTVQPWSAARVAFTVASLREHRWTVRVAVQTAPSSGPAVRRTFHVLPLVVDGSWEFRGAAEDFGVHGSRVLTLPATDSGYLHKLPNLWLEPSRRYRFTVHARRVGFKAAVSGSLLAVMGEKGRSVWKRYSLDRKRPGEWQVLTDTFETPRDLTRAGLYLYNVRSPDPAWFDDLSVEDLGPARAVATTP